MTNKPLPLEQRVGLALQIARQERNVLGNILADIYDQIERLKYEESNWNDTGSSIGILHHTKGDVLYRAHHAIVTFLRGVGYSEFDPARLAKLKQIVSQGVNYDGDDGGGYAASSDEDEYTGSSIHEFIRMETRLKSILEGTHPIYNTSNYLAKLFKIGAETAAIIGKSTVLPDSQK